MYQFIIPDCRADGAKVYQYGWLTREITNTASRAKYVLSYVISSDTIKALFDGKLAFLR